MIKFTIYIHKRRKGNKKNSFTQAHFTCFQIQNERTKEKKNENLNFSREIEKEKWSVHVNVHISRTKK